MKQNLLSGIVLSFVIAGASHAGIIAQTGFETGFPNAVAGGFAVTDASGDYWEAGAISGNYAGTWTGAKRTGSRSAVIGDQSNPNPYLLANPAGAEGIGTVDFWIAKTGNVSDAAQDPLIKVQWSTNGVSWVDALGETRIDNILSGEGWRNYNVVINQKGDVQVRILQTGVFNGTGNSHVSIDDMTIHSVSDTAVNVQPANGASSVRASTILEWAAPGTYAPTGYDVYFGTNSTATANPKVVDHALQTTYDPPGDLDGATTYTWQVDTYNGTTNTAGVSWSFTTQPATVLKVACVGDSITYGATILDRANDSYPAQLQALLGSGYDVGNFGRSSARVSTGSSLPYIGTTEYTAALAFEPDIVFIALGINDCYETGGQWDANQLVFEDSYKAIIAGFTNLASNPTIYVGTTMPITPVRPDYNTLNPNRMECDVLIEQVTADEGLPLIDIYTRLSLHPEYYADGIHPNATGAAILAGIVHETITVPIGADTYAPTPNPATFAVVPVASSSTEITMTATGGIDTSGPVEYLFTETSGNPGGTSSGWTTSHVYTDDGLAPGTEYTYTVQMRDALLNTGTVSAAASATAPLGPYGTLLSTASTFGTGTHWGTWDWQKFTLNDAGFTVSGDALPSPYSALAQIDLKRKDGAAGSTGDLWLGVFADPTKRSSLLGVSDQTVDIRSLSGGTTFSYTFTNSPLSLVVNTEYGLRVIVDDGNGTFGAEDTTLGSLRIGCVNPSAIAGGVQNGQDVDWDMQLTVVPSAGTVVAGIIQPASGTSSVPESALLEWSAPGAYTPTGYDVYFGTNSIATNNTKVVDNGLVTTYDPPGDLDWATTYTWQVDTYNGASKTTGAAWSFTTKPEILIKVACVGDSITYGDTLVDRANDSYPSQLQAILNGISASNQAYVVGNFGRNGACVSSISSNPYMVSPQYADSLAFEPDIVFIALGINDATPTRWATTKPVFTNDYKVLIAAYTNLASHPNIYIGSTMPITEVRGDYAAFEMNRLDCDVEIAKVASEEGLPLIDIHTRLSQYPQYYADGLHPNVTGAAILAEMVFEAITVPQGPDSYAPTPNPATFVVAPAAINSAKITMTATGGIDTTGPVQYRFTETSGNPGGTSSGWIHSNVYANTGLDPETTYSYTVQMRDSLGNTGTVSAPVSATTGAFVVGLHAINLSFEDDGISNTPLTGWVETSLGFRSAGRRRFPSGKRPRQLVPGLNRWPFCPAARR